jgi:GxxExxY protein
MVVVPLHYRGKDLNKQYVIDLLVEGEIIVEESLPVHEAQVISYLTLANKRPGLLINFNVPLLKYGFRRFIN